MSKANTVVAVKVPTGALRESFLKSLFENKKHSGGGSVTNVKIQDNNVFITFYSQEVATNVVARSPIIIYDNSVRVYSLREWEKSHGALSDEEESHYSSDREDSEEPLDIDNSGDGVCFYKSITVSNKERNGKVKGAHGGEPPVRDDSKNEDTLLPENKDNCTSKAVQKIERISMNCGKVQYIRNRNLLTQTTLPDRCTIQYGAKYIEISAPSDIIDDVKISVYQILNRVNELEMQLKDFAYPFLQKTQVLDRLHASAVDFGLTDLYLYVHSNSPTCSAFTLNDSEFSGIKTLVDNAIVEEKIDIESGYSDYIRTPEWGNFKRDVTKDKEVTLSEERRCLVVVGFSDDVTAVVDKLKLKLSSHATVSKQMDIPCGVCQLLRENYQQVDTMKIEAIGKTKRVEHDIGEGYITVTGNPQDVDKCLRVFTEKVKHISEIKFDIKDKQGLDHYMKRNDIAVNAIASIQTRYKCVISILSKNTKGNDVIVRRPSTAIKRGRGRDRRHFPSRHAREGSQVIVEGGNIVKFQQADAVVNTIPNSTANLSECGVMVKSFIQYGGSQVKSTISDILPLRPGEVTETSVSSDLPYNTIIHAGIGTWGKHFDKKRLSETISKCYDIANTKKLQSIAFPVIGGGRLRFPPKDVFDCLQTEASKRNIQTYMVIYDDEKLVGELRDRASQGEINRGESESKSRASNVQAVKEAITKCKADVLVNPICDHNPDIEQCGALALAFATEAGSDLVDEVEDGLPLRCGDVVATTGGKLRCKMVIHASIRRWIGDKTKQKLNEVVEKCMHITADKGYNSIAFPPIGCGRLRFPPDEVYKAIAKAATKPGRSNIKVSILSIKDDLHKTFQRYISGESDEERKTREDDSDENIPPPALDASPFSFDMTFSSDSRDQGTKPKTADVTFHILAFTKTDTTKAKDGITDHIKKRFLSEKIRSDVLKYLRMAEIQRSLFCYGSQTLAVRADQGSGIVELTGERDIVRDAAHKIELYLKDMEQRLYEEPEYLKLMGRSMGKHGSQVPKTWTKFKGGTPIRDIYNESPKRAKVDHSTEKAITRLIKEIWDVKPIPTGCGADAVGLSHNSLTITDIERIENPKLFGDYDDKKRSFTWRAKQKAFPKLAGNRGQDDLLTYTKANKEVKKWIDGTVNERLLFHGTNNMDAVWKQGPDFRMAGDGGIFGRGIYLAESPAKADQYTARWF